MSKAERLHWDERYRARGVDPEPPATFLREVADRFPSGAEVLDVGGGSGRNAVWLARRGHEVTIVDISAVALDLAGRRAGELGVDVGLIPADLEAEPLPPGPWDVIIEFHYLHRRLFSSYMTVLRPGGLLVIAQATVANLERHERPPLPFLLEPGEGRDLLSGFELLIYREGWSVEGRHEVEALARKPFTTLEPPSR